MMRPRASDGRNESKADTAPFDQVVHLSGSHRRFKRQLIVEVRFISFDCC